LELCILRLGPLRLFLGRELLLHLESDGIGIDLICGRCFLEDSGWIAARGRQQDAGLDQQPGERSFIGAAYEGGEGLLHTAIVALLPDAVLPRQHLDAALIHKEQQPLDDRQQVTLHQAHRDSGTDGGKDAKAKGVGNGLLLPLLFLFGLPLPIIAVGSLLGMMHRAGEIGAHLVDGADVRAFGDDGLGGVLAFLELGALGFIFGLRPLASNRGVLVARQHRATFLLSAESRADLYQLRFRGEALRDVRVYLQLIAGRGGALCGIRATGKYFPLARRRVSRVR
jgi:hypothetical protein